ncbi:amino acid deaminase [Mycolicibacterium smegmatis]|uniref:amino acid deaminase n=1 Tax=Mycolicibacterium smegmatis TaxID=1772 RepID=UPI0013033BC1|nr:amino acid deaminase [Mycolicibacterium smegmatis]MCP2621568.1 amino acid deaminase [Mycolicibacterium smegmatis]UGU32866.1 amino acid deaminase [Mycolicibacterium smegmatis]ULN32644.1 amino acid deaminase [Mycolicibacterium smegmatis]ULN67750.1 amino acid deaminase [Mycolicibacterium smegmatis]
MRTTTTRAEHLSELDKALPSEADGLSVQEFLATRPRLSSFSTPVLTLDDSAIDQNLSAMAAWCADNGIDLAPHGKTTMSPTLWERQLRAGATAITLATFSQVRVAVHFGVRRILLANALVDPGALRWLVQHMTDDPELHVVVWADSTATVDAMTAALADVPVAQPVPVLVELGAPGGRTGARSVDDAMVVAERIAACGVLRLAGVAGYEGALAHDASEPSLARVRAYLQEMARLHRTITDRGLYDPTIDVIVTAGGSAYFDVVAEVLAPLAGPRVRVVVRAGAYVIHDDGFYTGITPFGRTPGGYRLRSAMHAWARVVSRPEPELALLDAGKRDVPFDEGLPVPQLVAAQLGAPARPLTGTQITAVNDQHAFLALPADSDVKVGDVVRLGLSHPCTAFDKWRWIPLLNGNGDDPHVVDMIRTYF